jgi:D-sedoheptulose 7-phosphate isomerase
VPVKRKPSKIAHNRGTVTPPASSLKIALQNVNENFGVTDAMLENRALINSIARIGEILAMALQRQNKIFFFGNGGSAADAQHLAAELMVRFEHKRRALPAIALTVNTSNLTAIGNDLSFDAVFSRQLEGLGNPGDVAVGLSTSGESLNVLKGLRTAKMIGMVTVGLTGQRCGKMSSSVDYCINVPSSRTARIQEAHVLIGHILCEIVEKMIVAKTVKI